MPQIPDSETEVPEDTTSKQDAAKMSSDGEEMDYDDIEFEDDEGIEDGTYRSLSCSRRSVLTIFVPIDNGSQTSIGEAYDAFDDVVAG